MPASKSPNGKAAQEILDSAVFAEADCVSVTGTDETLAAVRSKLPIKTRFLGYGTRAVAFVTREALAAHPKQLAKLARATTSLRGINKDACLRMSSTSNPAAKATPELFAQRLSEELEALEDHQPRAQLKPAEAAGIATRRSFYEVRAAHSPETQMWARQIRRHGPSFLKATRDSRSPA